MVCRPTASSVSALSGFVANGRRTLHSVFSPLSKIPYGGFSPVRLQTGRQSRLFAFSARAGTLIAAPKPPGRRKPFPPHNVGAVLHHGGMPVQRPLARHRVVLSRQVIAYYGLIRGSGLLPAAYSFRRPGLCLAAKAQRFPNLLCVSLDPCHRLYPGAQAA